MTARLQRPLLIGGLGLTFGLWGLDSISHSLAGVGDWLTLGTIAAGGGYLWYRQRGSGTQIPLAQVEIDRESIDRLSKQVALVISQLASESPQSGQIDLFRQQLTQAESNLTRPERHIAITGGHRVGKSSLLQIVTTTPVPAATPLRYTETPALFTSGASGDTATATAEKLALSADLVLFLTNGDLTATEYKCLSTLAQAKQRVVLLLNQSDRYLPDERQLILQKLQMTVAGIVNPTDIIATSTAPAPIKVRSLQADGTAIDRLETPPVEITNLQQQLSQILAQEGEKLVWANTYRQLTGVQVAAKSALNRVRRDRALPTIDRNQWIVGAAAFANPVPALDLLATAAVNAQMVVDLGAIYQQKFSLEHAQAAAGAMGNVMLKLGLVELCTQTVAGVLKTNAATYVAGGLVQGLSAAYLTRIAGLTLVEYLEAQDLVTPESGRAWNLDLLGNTLQKVFQANQRAAYLQTLVKQGVDQLMPNGTATSAI
ncbi:DUF697 domain-containing protein [Chamaesiphon sp. VAR_69_metabat_338]|uniref:YcjF family protein n=1 Tax=Chamaesiphon sp. VAR_69_metabat_338 TaxID=2964704 RepID=UPI00286E6E39|nr:DUF697 domain-containing protein [Chamaesiphon sp. VAR_69_metabat_338]